MIEHYVYLICLLVGIAGLLIIDRRYKLALWLDAKRALITIGIGILLFSTWDLLGIKLGIFFHGSSIYTLPFRIFPEFPIEELFFLFLLCYVTLLLYQGAKKVWPRT